MKYFVDEPMVSLRKTEKEESKMGGPYGFESSDNCQSCRCVLVTFFASSLFRR